MQNKTSSQFENRSSKHYDHIKCEKESLNLWSKIVNSSEISPSSRGPFCFLLPPPNVTGSLHMGHALTTTIQDLLARFKKMIGHEVLWIPGADHAGIATQSVLDRSLRAKEGKSLRSFGRKEALAKLQSWSEQNKQCIVKQLEHLGCLLSWRKFMFSMDPVANQAVRTAFKKAVDNDLIYQGNYLVNWDFGTGTALSDDEVIYEERTSLLVLISYSVGEIEIPIATTRPETIWGDVAIAVHPKDARYSHLIGKKAIVPIVKREIPIIADSRVSIEFGTGAVKITPGHDLLDYKIGLDHNLPMISILDESGRLKDSGEITGLTILEARKLIILLLEEGGFLCDRQRHLHRIGVSYRSGVPIEPILSKQWFFRLSAFACELESALDSGHIRLLPKGKWDATYKHWVRNLHDWCISRQLWWGHRIPVWYKKDTNEWICSDQCPEEVSQNPEEWQQDEDVLDTWFSSALWPITTLGWPNDNQDLTKFYPNQLCETGFDILFFWVTRMLVLCKFLTGQWPFKDIYLHGLIYSKSYWIESEDKISYIVGEERKGYEKKQVPIPKGIKTKWEKMSKSKGNIMDPLELAQEYGTDAMRVALISFISDSNELDLDYRKFEEYRNFTNKLWNASRFVLKIILETEWPSIHQSLNNKMFSLEDRWILSKWYHVTQKVNESLDQYEFLTALQYILNFFWCDFCDYYIELAKSCIYNDQENSQKKILKRDILIHLIIGSLRLQHPFIPFITEEIFQQMKEALASLEGKICTFQETCNLFNQNEQALKQTSCLLSSYPSLDPTLVDISSETSFDNIREIIRSIRKLRAEARLHPSAYANIFLEGWDYDQGETTRIICSMVKVSCLTYGPPSSDQKTTTSLLGRHVIHLALEEVMNEERKRLEKECLIIDREIKRLQILIKNPQFLENAPEHVLHKQIEAVSRLQEQRKVIETKLN